jgi:hypothetical protein
MLTLCGLSFENRNYMLPLELAMSRIYEEGAAGSVGVKNKNASNVDDLELAKQLQNFIELEDAPLKGSSRTICPQGATTPSPRRAEHIYS